MKKILIIVMLLAAGCRNDYSTKPAPFKDGDYVRIKFDATKSFIPHCGTPDMRFQVTNHYLIQDQIFWWYDLKSDDGCILIHVENDQLKKW